jgi:hypothetical protein
LQHIYLLHGSSHYFLSFITLDLSPCFFCPKVISYFFFYSKDDWMICAILLKASSSHLKNGAISSSLEVNDVGRCKLMQKKLNSNITVKIRRIPLTQITTFSIDPCPCDDWWNSVLWLMMLVFMTLFELVLCIDCWCIVGLLPTMTSVA